MSKTPTEPGIAFPDPREIGLRIRTTRRRQKLTQSDVAARAGIDKGYLSRLERGEKTASVGTLHMVATSLGTSLSMLVGESHPKDDIRVTRAESFQPDTKDTRLVAAHQKTIL